jgi:hypothetical protein
MVLRYTGQGDEQVVVGSVASKPKSSACTGGRRQVALDARVMAMTPRRAWRWGKRAQAALVVGILRALVGIQTSQQKVLAPGRSLPYPGVAC